MTECDGLMRAGELRADDVVSSGEVDWAPTRPLCDATTRLLDIAIAGAVLVLLSPLWFAVALMVRISSPGPALFRGTVIGRGGRPFTYYKFRSMLAGDDCHHPAWLRAFVTADAPHSDGQ